MCENESYSTFVAKAEFFTRKNLSKKLQIFYKLKICDKVLFSIYTLKTKMSFKAFVNETLLSFITQLSLFLRLQFSVLN